MKKLSVLLAALLVFHTQMFAQAPTQGTITYNMTIQLRKQVAKQNPAIASMVPETTSTKVKVAFKNEIFSVSMEPGNASGGAGVQMQMNTTGRQIVNLKTKVTRNENVFSKKKYYSESALKPATSITYVAGTRKILGYTCSKALVTGNDKKKYTVWYTTAIPYAYNPDGDQFAGLKGAVLEYDNGEQSCVATAIDARKFTPAAIAPDAGAKKISKEQMEDLQDEEEAGVVPAKGKKGNTEEYHIKL